MLVKAGDLWIRAADIKFIGATEAVVSLTVDGVGAPVNFEPPSGKTGQEAADELAAQVNWAHDFAKGGAAETSPAISP